MKKPVYLLTILIAICSHLAHAQDDPEWLRAPYLNTVLSIQHESAMREFYGKVLGLESQPDFDLPARVGRPFDTIMIRFKIGKSTIKMIPHEDISRPPGGRDTAAGLRVLSIPITDGKGVAERVKASSGQTIEWLDEGNYTVGWVRDPDDNEIELRWYGAEASEIDRCRLELCITATDLDASAQYYGKQLGLHELSPIDYTGFPGKTRRFSVGESVLRIWTSDKRLTKDTGFTKDGYGLRYVQFIVNDAYELHAKLIERNADIAQEPTPLGKSTTLLFAMDPDGVINECVGPARRN
ncbi:MAG: VOC family protein [Candidatus Hydrogenedentota bacterium]